MNGHETGVASQIVVWVHVFTFLKEYSLEKLNECVSVLSFVAGIKHIL